MQITTEPLKGLSYGQTSVATATATAIPPAASVNAARQQVLVRNLSATVTFYYAWDSSVTNSNGFPLLPNEELALSFEAASPLFLYQGSGGSVSVAWAELGLA